MSYQKAQGTIEAVSRSGKQFKLEGDERWFGAFRVAQLNRAEKGSTVSLEFEEVEKGGTTFYNVKGDVKLEEGGAVSRSAPSAGAAQSVAGDSRQQSIIRQNSLSQANALYRTIVGEAGDAEIHQDPDELKAIAQELIDIARIFEAYSNGEV